MESSGMWAEPQAPPQAQAQAQEQVQVPVAPLPPQPQPEPQVYNAPPQPAQQHHLPHPATYSSYHYPNTTPVPNPNPNPNPYPNVNPETPVQSDACASHLGFPADPYGHAFYAPRGGHVGLHPAPYSYPGGAGQPAVPGVSYYYHGHGGSEPHGYAVQQVIHPFGADPLGYGTGLPRSSIGLEAQIPFQFHMKPPHWKKKAIPLTSKLTKKRIPKGQKWTTKVVQSAYCEVCKINCDTQEVLMIHKQGKKHKKNLQKLQESFTAKMKKAPTAIVEKETLVAEKGNTVGEQKRKKDAPTTAEELEEKKRRVLEGGASAEEVKVCTICNVVVNSQKVYEYHIAGQKHAAMVKKHQEKAAITS